MASTNIRVFALQTTKGIYVKRFSVSTLTNISHMYISCKKKTQLHGFYNEYKIFALLFGLQYMVIGVNGTSGRNALKHAATGQNLERDIAPILPHITAGNFALATTRK